jgi:hypothetical protein
MDPWGEMWFLNGLRAGTDGSQDGVPGRRGRFPSHCVQEFAGFTASSRKGLGAITSKVLIFMGSIFRFRFSEDGPSPAF